MEYYLRPANYSRSLLRQNENEAMTDYVNLITSKCSKERQIMSKLKYQLRRTNDLERKKEISRAIDMVSLENCKEYQRIEQILGGY